MIFFFIKQFNSTLDVTTTPTLLIYKEKGQRFIGSYIRIMCHDGFYKATENVTYAIADSHRFGEFEIMFASKLPEKVGQWEVKFDNKGKLVLGNEYIKKTLIAKVSPAKKKRKRSDSECSGEQDPKKANRNK